MNAEAVGKAATFIQKSLVAKTLKFHAPLLKQSLETFGSIEKTKKLKSSKIVQISAQRNLFGQLLILSEDNNFTEGTAISTWFCAMGFSYTGWALATPDGLPVKTKKAKLRHQLEDDAALVHRPCLDDLGAYVVDRNALLHALTVSDVWRVV